MADKKSKKKEETAPEVTEELETAETPEAVEENPLEGELAAAKEALAQKEDAFLRLAAEYDNYRKRTAKERDAAWTAAKGDTVKQFLPVYDNLERALKQETSDEAYRKGVELIMAELKKIFTALGLEEIPALGQSFDANVHNAVMHVEDEAVGENTIVEVFQTGFKLGDQIVRYAMVKVAN